MSPVRVQLRRTKGWKMPPNTVKVDRSTRWGNSWRVGSNMFDPTLGKFRVCETVEDAVQTFRQKCDYDPSRPSYLGPNKDGDYLEIWGGYDDNIHVNRRSIRRFLAGKNLACWCALDAACHADVLLEFANGPDAEREAVVPRAAHAVEPNDTTPESSFDKRRAPVEGR